ncbi:RING-H2 finger protein [Quillaja saponaria]|uniref:RING-type E3 ubiquitin transferase n=1 Tax=Quillaja saponaria TaxID=32244 RepID=A0AAD7L6W2_QUISA|nr:RING-H2 finger protein [Quillaja saponaria]
MDTFIFFILFCVSIFQSIEVLNANCPPIKCSVAGPEIRFPFRVEGQHSQNCNTSGNFELICEDNTTTIHFPSYGNMIVESISYDTRKLDLLDPKSCVHEVFLNLNLSLTPFLYYHVLKNYTYLNCSASLSPSFTEIPCLSGSDCHFYTVDPSLPVPVSCKKVKTVAIPFAYSPYLSDNTFGLGLTWDLPESEEYRAGHQTEHFYITDNTVVSISIIIFAAAAAISMKIHYNKKHCHQMEGDVLMRLTG